VESWVDGYVNKNPHRNAFFTHVQSLMANLIQTRFYRLTPWVNIVIYFIWYPNWFGRSGVRIFPSPIDFNIGF